MLENKKVETQNKVSAEAELNQTIKYISLRNGNINRYTDKLNQEVGAILNAVESLKISRDITYTDIKPFVVNMLDENYFVTEEGFLHLENGNVRMKFVRSNMDGEYKSEYWNYIQLPRRERKAIIASGRLPQFLLAVAAKLADEEKEYEKAAETATKMAAAIT